MESDHLVKALPMFRKMWWFATIFWLGICSFFIKQWLVGKLLPSDREVAPFLFMAFLSFQALLLFLLCKSYDCYIWDENGVVRHSWLGEKRIAWSEVTRIRIRRILGRYDYILYGGTTKKLVIDFVLIGENNSLFDEIQARLKEVIEQSLSMPGKGMEAKIDDVGETRIGPVRMGVVSFTYKGLFFKKTILYADIRHVFRMVQVGDGYQFYHFSDGTRDRLRLCSGVRDFDRIIRALKKRMPEAKWFEREVEDTPENARIILQRDLIEVQKRLKEEYFVSVFVMGPLMGGMLGWLIWNSHHAKRGPAICLIIILLYGIFRFIYDRRKNRRLEKLLMEALREVEERIIQGQPTQ